MDDKEISVTAPVGPIQGEAAQEQPDSSRPGIVSSLENFTRHFTGRRKKKRGRYKTREVVPEISAEVGSIDDQEPVSGSLENEAMRLEFEISLVSIVAMACDELADSSYRVLRAKYADQLAREASNCYRITDSEKAMIGPIASRLWKKYVTLNFSYTDEMMVTMILLKYYMRIREPMRLVAEANKPVKPEDARPS
jgi:hypothetical protein